jgi:hypothetical protein
MTTYSLHTLFGLRGALEAAKGDATAPTRPLYPTTAEETRSFGSIAVQPLRSNYRPTTLVYPGIDKTTLKLGGPFLYNEQSFWMSLAITGGLTGAGGGADKTWSFTPTAATDDVKSAALEYGWVGGTTLFALNYCQVDKYRLKFAKGSEVTWEADIVSPKAPTAIANFTGTGTDLVHIAAPGPTVNCYIDTTTIGTTPDPLVVSADWELDKGAVVTYPLNATTVGIDVVRPKAENWKLTLTRMYGTNTERTAYIAKSLRKIRLAAVGPSLGGGTYKLWLDCYGYIDDISWAEVDGVVAEKVTVLPLYNVAAGSDYVVVLVNALGSIT